MWLNHFSIMCGLSSKMFQVSNLSIVLSFAIFWKLHIIGFTCGNKFTPILYFCTWKRDEGKISCKLVECINTYLLKDEPNLGGKSLEIHQALNHFVFRCWFATHDRSLKCVLSELVDVMSKELDQMSTSSTNSPWGEKCGIMTSSQFKVAELGDLVFCQVCANTYKSPVTEKRARREHVVVLIKERVMGGKWPQHAALVCLICILASVKITYCFGLTAYLQILEGWQRLACDMELPYAEFANILQSHLNLYKRFMSCSLEIWDLRLFKHTLSTVMMLGNILQFCFVLHLMLLLQENLAAVMVVGKYLNGAHSTVDIVKSMMTMRSIQGDLQDFLYLRQNVLPAFLAILNLKEFTTLNEQFVVLLPAAAYALSTGSTPLLYDASGLLPLLYATEPVEELAKAVFIISVVAAIDPSQRELVSAVLDSLSKEACYTNRTKFLEELMGSILFNWVACGVSLVALVEAIDIFTSNLEPMNFIKYCCLWLLPALILQEDANSLKWVAKVSIVNHTLSLASSSSDCPLPFFSKDKIACVIQTIVDGFLDSEEHSKSFELVDKDRT
ncbi:serine/threonine-protein kinase ATM-like [Primulina eburnea]|uniref:serine/threonine-protein kinase ATM-like n=1 Tax=Primulina eburnea TaxID=1245227 RepID=UPI003C6C8843